MAVSWWQSSDLPGVGHAPFSTIQSLFDTLAHLRNIP
jgi:hypothetical protein